MSSIANLSRLERVPLRRAWPNEAANFTPWLAEKQNIDLLGETLGIPLQVEAVEKEVGPFFADILAREPDTDRWVLIENQITPTDHGHLGQLLTYAAGLDARTIIWIAETFREEHRAAVDFLNRATSEDFAFFAIQIELYRIGDSPLAPQFAIVAKPNDWSKRTHSARQAAQAESESPALWESYWRGMIDFAKFQYAALRSRAPYRGNWQAFEMLRGGNPSFVLNATFPWNRSPRVEIYIDGKLAKAGFGALKVKRDQIESALGTALSWEEMPDRQACRVALYSDFPAGRPDDPALREAQYRWLASNGQRLADAVRPYVKEISVAEGE